MSQTSFEKRIEIGQAIRDSVPRASHSSVGDVKRDPIKLLKANSSGRVERLIPLRYGRMLASPFAFYRGSAILQAHDLATTPHTGLTVQICGDAHLMNFGGFATPERNLVFDMNDFDETHPGPWEWDVKRLAASITVAARSLGFKSAAADKMVFNAVENYRTCMIEFSRMGALDLWYEMTTFDELLKRSKYEEGRKAIAKAMEKAQSRTQKSLLPKMANKVNGRWQFREDPPELFHHSGENSLFGTKDPARKLDLQKVFYDKYFKAYLGSIRPSHRQLLENFSMQDIAFKAVGVGSVGTRCWVMLLTDLQDQPLFLQVKQASRSVLAPYVPSGKSEFKNEGQRVITGQRLMQSASDMFLGWVDGPANRDFYFRQMRDMKVSFELETLSELMLGRYAWLCAHILARAHARGSNGLAPQISGYMGKSGQFAEALVNYADDYADQVERDFDAFRDACRSGKLIAQSEADFGADIRA
ncbi:MAG: DUF2252 domain-containing protein [Arenimonas sp.]|jgi:uncharacterized protein (DUF2252 family)|nr:DUF2252 domain-containing protein [Arenimonas sp.]